jgi:hypothetical protein
MVESDGLEGVQIDRRGVGLMVDGRVDSLGKVSRAPKGKCRLTNGVKSTTSISPNFEIDDSYLKAVNTVK